MIWRLNVEAGCQTLGQLAHLVGIGEPKADFFEHFGRKEMAHCSQKGIFANNAWISRGADLFCFATS